MSDHKASCEWAFDWDGFWVSDCDLTFFFDSGEPKENSFNYCPKCGKPLKQLEVENE